MVPGADQIGCQNQDSAMASTTTLAWMTDAHREFVVKPEGHMIATKRRAQSEGIDEDMTDISHQLKRSKVELITWQQKRPWDLMS